MHKEPKNIIEVNDNLIELRQNLVVKKRELTKIHNKFHEEKIKTPLHEVKGVESDIAQLEELISITKLQKENLLYTDELTKCREKIKALGIEINKLKLKLKNK